MSMAQIGSLDLRKLHNVRARAIALRSAQQIHRIL